MPPSISRRSLLNYIGIAILLAGMGFGELIYWRSLQRIGTDGGDSSPSPYASRAYERDVEVNVGKFGLILDQWSHLFAKLGEPKPLAITITAVSILAAGGCFIKALQMPRD